MFNNLLESRAKKQRSTGGSIVSLILHVALGTAAVYGTLHANDKKDEDKVEEVKFVETPKEEPKPPEPEKTPPPPDVTVVNPPPKGFQVLAAPVNIPDVIPDIDLSKKVTDEADFSGKGVAGGIAKGVEGGAGPVTTDQPYFEFQVEKPVVQAPGSAQPKFPDQLRTAGIAGEVLAQFVVDTTGRAEPGTFKVLKSTHELFTLAVKNALPNMRFLPAEVGGHKVKQLVQQPFAFAIQ